MKNCGVEWINLIPDHWEIKRLKQILAERNEKNNPIKSKNLLSLSIEKGVFPYSEKTGGGNKAKENFEDYKLTYENDIVINSMNVIVGAVGLSKYFGCVSPVYYTLYNRSQKNDIRYFNFIFQSAAFQKSLWGLGNGIVVKESSNGKLNTIRMRIPMEKLNNVLIPIPPKNEQKKISEYLEKQTKEIDKIIFKTKENIENYKNYKNSLIIKLCTKGTTVKNDFNKKIDWINEVSSNWKIVKIGQIFEQIKCKNKGTNEKNLLSLSYGNIVRRNIDADTGLLPENFEGYNIIENGDIVLRLTDLQNDHKSLRVGLCNERGIITSAYISIRLKNNYNSKYFYYLLHSFDIKKGFYGMGSGVRQGLTWNELRDMQVVVPPVNEQNEIVRVLEDRIRKIDNLVIAKQKIIDELEQYKKSLIYEYVTGKKEVI